MSRAPRSCRALLPLLRRLHLAELVHLRAHAARLEAQLASLLAENEHLQRAADDADDRAAMFHDALIAADELRLTLTRDGVLGVEPREV